MGIGLGVLVALIILFSQTFYFQYVESVEGNPAETEQTTDLDDSDGSILEMGYQVLTLVVEYVIRNIVHFISNIYPADTKSSHHSVHSHHDGIASYLQVLFHAIISPNAP